MKNYRKMVERAKAIIEKFEGSNRPIDIDTVKYNKRRVAELEKMISIMDKQGR